MVCRQGYILYMGQGGEGVQKSKEDGMKVECVESTTTTRSADTETFLCLCLHVHVHHMSTFLFSQCMDRPLQAFKHSLTWEA